MTRLKFKKEIVLLDRFLAVTLDRYKRGEFNRVEAVGQIAHLVAAIDRPDGDDHRAYMAAVIADKDA